MKNKLFCLFVASIFLCIVCFSTQAFAQADEVSVVLDGQKLSFDVPPSIIDGRTMVPLRVIFEAMGASVSWDEQTNTVTSEKEDITVSITIDVPEIIIDGNCVSLDVAPQIVSGRTLVPARAIAEGFGAKVEWNGDIRTVFIYTETSKPSGKNIAPSTLFVGHIKSDGTFSENTQYYHTEMIPLDTSKLCVHVAMNNSTMKKYMGARHIAFYDTNQALVEYIDNPSGLKVFYIPANAAYFCFDSYSSSGKDISPVAYCDNEYSDIIQLEQDNKPQEVPQPEQDKTDNPEDAESTEKEDNSNEDSGIVPEEILEIKQSLNVAPPIWESGVVNSTGGISGNGTFYHTEYIPLDTDKKYVHIAGAYIGKTGFTHAAQLAFYDNEKNYLADSFIENGESEQKTFVIPNDASYVRFSLWHGKEITISPFVYCDDNQSIDTGLYTEYSRQVIIKPESVPGASSWYGKNVLVIGDSLSASGVWQRELVDLLGMNVTTHAKGGQGIVQLVDGEKGAGAFDNETAADGILLPLCAEDVKDKDLVIFFTGYNDRNFDDGKVGDVYPQNNTVAGRTQYAINRIYEELKKADNLDCRVAIITPHCAGKYGYCDVDGYGEYPKASGVKGETLETLADTMQAVAEFNGIPCYNAWKNSGINRFTWEIYSASKTSQNADGNGAGPYPYNNDQLHLNAASGYPHLGRCIANWIKSI